MESVEDRERYFWELGVKRAFGCELSRDVLLEEFRKGVSERDISFWKSRGGFRDGEKFLCMMKIYNEKYYG